MNAPAVLDRRAAVRRLLAEREALLVVAGLGSPAWDCTAAGDRALSYPLWGAMGSAVPMGLGLALAQPARRVLVVTGDGELLMGLGALASVGARAPRNLAVVVLDNERYGETGMQRSHTAYGADLAAIALGAGFTEAVTVGDEGALEEVLPLVHEAPGPILAVLKIAEARHPLVMPPRDAVVLKTRFRGALLGAAAGE